MSAPWTIRSPSSQNKLSTVYLSLSQKITTKLRITVHLDIWGSRWQKWKRLIFFTNCKPGLLQVLRQEQSHQFFRCGCCGCCKMGNIPPMLLWCFLILNLWRLAHASALTSSTFSSSSAVSSPINSPTYDFFISFLSNPCSIIIAWPC